MAHSGWREDSRPAAEQVPAEYAIGGEDRVRCGDSGIGGKFAVIAVESERSILAPKPITRTFSRLCVLDGGFTSIDVGNAAVIKQRER